MTVHKTVFDADKGICQYTLTNECGQLTVKILDYGATIVSILFADKDNTVRDLVLGFDCLDGYLSKQLKNPYFGATVGRVANRIANASFKLDDQLYQLEANSGTNNIHGGPRGFDKQKWNVIEQNNTSVKMELFSDDGDQNFPGSLRTQIEFTVTENNELKLDYTAQLEKDSTKRTVVNLTNHSYFNLSGTFDQQSSKILDHQVLMEATKYLEVDDNLIPTGEISSLTGTPLDFSKSFKGIGEHVDQVKPNGYDHCYVLEDNEQNYKINPDTMRKAVQVYSPVTGIKMNFSTTEPAFQFYTGSKIAEGHKPKRSQTNDDSVVIGSYSGFCLEAQRFPNAINNPKWSKQVILHKDQKYRQISVYGFQLTSND